MTHDLLKFQPTCNRPSEQRKAHFKNLNLAVLQHWYLGHAGAELRCLITRTPGWVTHANTVTGVSQTRFRLDFNHIRQQNRFLLGLTRTKSPGVSVDKTRDPSAIFRSVDLTRPDRAMLLLEFMTCMPVTTEYHKYITQDSSTAHVCLAHYSADTWPWGLQSRANFQQFQLTYWHHVLIDYDAFVTLLCDPLAPPYWSQWQI